MASLTPEQLAALSGAAGTIGIAGDLASGFFGARAYQDQADLQRLAGGINRDFANLQAEDAIKRGDVAAARYGQKVGRLIGSQRAGYAAQGVAVNTGSAAAVQDEARLEGALDAQQIRNNAWREAFGLRAQGSGYVRDANLSAMASEGAGRGTLATAGWRALQGGVDVYRDFKKAGG